MLASAPTGSRPRRRRPRPRRSRATASAEQAAPAVASPPPERSPQRRCIVTGEIRGRASLLRFVVGPDGTAVPDIDTCLPGRGLWLTPRRDIVERAVAKRIFARAARRPVTASPELADRIETLLARRCGDWLGLARRSGLAAAGFDRVGEALRRGRAALLLSALDGAAGSGSRLPFAARSLPSAEVLTSAELGAAFGRERIVHAAVAGGPLCRRLLLDLWRLAGFRAGATVGNIRSATPAIEDGGIEAHD